MSPATKIVAVQASMGAIISGAFFLWSIAAGTSALLATGCVLLPTMYFAWAHTRTFAAAQILAHGVVKMALTVALMVVAIAVVGIEPVGFFVTFVALHCSYLWQPKQIPSGG